MKKILLVCLIAGCLAACNTRPMVNVQNQTIPTSSAGAPMTLSLVEESIRAGAQRAGWTTQVLRPGLIEATVTARSHRVVVSIPFDQKSYSIDYKDSDNMKAEGDEIHKKYNAWVLRLSQSIRSELNANSTKKQ